MQLNDISNRAKEIIHQLLRKIKEKLPERRKVKDYWIGFYRHYIVGLINGADQREVFFSAGGLAYSFIITTIPINLVLFSILGMVLDSATIQSQITNLIDAFIPYPEVADKARSIIINRSEEVIQYRTIAGIIGIAGLLFAGAGLFSSMRTVLNKIFGISEVKHVIIGKLRDVMMIFLIILFILLAAIVFPILNVVKEIIDKIEFLDFLEISGFVDTLFSYVPILIVFLMFYIFYFFIPYEKLGKRVPAVASFWTTILWVIAQQLFGIYITQFATLSKLYGTYALIVIIIFWIYYTSLLFLIGAEIGQLYRERRLAQNEET